MFFCSNVCCRKTQESDLHRKVLLIIMRTEILRKIRKTLLGGLFLLVVLLLVVPLAVLAYIEIEVDPIPKSYLLSRINNTHFVVKAHAELLVDGETLYLSRTIRCVTPIFARGALMAASGIVHDGQVGDTISATTRKGRMFVIPVSRVCAVFRDDVLALNRSQKNDQDIKIRLKSYALSRNELEIPIVFEVIGEAPYPTQVDAYIARQRIMTGYHGVQLKELSISQEPPPARKWDFIVDWTDYDWFGQPSWMRPYSPMGDRDYQIAGFVVQVPKEIWSKSDLPGTDVASVTLNRMATYFKDTLKLNELTEDLNLTDIKDAARVLTFWDQVDFITLTTSPKLRTKAEKKVSPREMYSWALNNIIPCAFDDDAKFVCHPNRDGILEYRPFRKGMTLRKKTEEGQVTEVSIEDKVISTNSRLYFAYFNFIQQKLWMSGMVEASLGRRR